MVKYTTKDIVKRAEQLADLENSDFISDYEKQFLLNENWQVLYQKIINANDRTFLRCCNVEDGMRLPSDLLEIAALYLTQSKDAITKINATQTTGYDIRDNRIYFSEAYRNSEITLEYYPEPQTLFYCSDKANDASFSSVPKMLIENKRYYLTADNTIIDNDTGITLGTYSGEGLCFKNGYIKGRSFYNWQNETVETKNDMPFVVKGNEVTFDDVQSSEDLSRFVIVLTDTTEEQLFFVDENFVIYDRNKESVSVALDSNSLCYCRQDGLYVSDNGSNKITRICGKTVEVFSLSLSDFCCFVDEQHYIEQRGNLFFEKNYGPSTLLNYPNNIYFILLSYALAISFKLKQNGDVNNLSVKYAEALQQFNDSLQKDINVNYQIKNVYTRRRAIW